MQRAWIISNYINPLNTERDRHRDREEIVCRLAAVVSMTAVRRQYWVKYH
jgi:hypothetical protein